MQGTRQTREGHGTDKHREHLTFTQTHSMHRKTMYHIYTFITNMTLYSIYSYNIHVIHVCVLDEVVFVNMYVHVCTSVHELNNFRDYTCVHLCV